MAGIETDVREFVIDNFLFGDEPLGDTDSFLEQGVIDSTGVLELVGFLEQRYAIAIADHELVPANLDSIERVAAFIRRKLNPENTVAG